MEKGNERLKSFHRAKIVKLKTSLCKSELNLVLNSPIPLNKIYCVMTIKQ